MLQTSYALLESEWQCVMLMHNDDVNEDGEFDAWCLSERSCYSVNDRGKLGEKELRVLQIGVEPTTLWLILWLLYHCAIIIVLALKKSSLRQVKQIQIFAMNTGIERVIVAICLDVAHM